MCRVEWCRGSCAAVEEGGGAVVSADGSQDEQAPRRALDQMKGGRESRCRYVRARGRQVRVLVPRVVKVRAGANAHAPFQIRRLRCLSEKKRNSVLVSVR